MSLANRLTFLRIILAPLFFILYLLPVYFPSLFPYGAAWTIPFLWIIAIVAQLTDLFDGMAARKHNEVSDFGKFFDPFADTILQLTGILCFVIDGIFPAFLFLLVIYREYSILFIRNLMMKKGIAMGARISGKIKTVTYIIAEAVALMAGSIQRLGKFEFLFPIFKNIAIAIFIVAVTVAIVSFFDYYSVYRRATAKV
jgi:CDP-diacylglycerol--glycerol-3-phosphate 3-phosphatidyltransferase